jgi:hypothetical protein
MSAVFADQVRGVDEWSWARWKEAMPGSPFAEKGEEILSLSQTLATTPRSLLAATFHRGRLRGWSEGMGWKGFPETDALGFVPTASDGFDEEDKKALAGLHLHDYSQWVAAGQTCPEGMKEAFVRWLGHHAGCPKGWGEPYAKQRHLPLPAAEILDSEPKAAPTEESCLEVLRLASAWWGERVLDQPFTEAYVWRRPVKGDIQWPFWLLALHTANHGAYHRGHLKGLSESLGVEWDLSESLS